MILQYHNYNINNTKVSILCVGVRSSMPYAAFWMSGKTFPVVTISAGWRYPRQLTRNISRS